MIHKKRGYFFVLDAALGIFVLAIGAFLIASLYINLPEPSQVGLLSDDFLDFLSDTQIKDLNNPYAGIGGQLWKEGSITNRDNSLLQQIGEFYSKGQYSLAEKFIQNVSANTVPSQFNYELWIDGQILYPRNPSPEEIASKSKTALMLTSKKITFGVANTTESSLWGPYKAEVFVWQK
ncbi:MAG TPA: hypothetical protein VJI52_05105 [Candidatus Nanoarchaeia archaeon]|nr:hypothetical protein [Candidatus Nanoarchaeia archaeon]